MTPQAGVCRQGVPPWEEFELPPAGHFVEEGEVPQEAEHNQPLLP